MNGGTDSLWSHFTGMQEPLEIGDWRFEHFTIASIHSGVGTVVHEMLHQMGALDLYDVHSDLPSSNWNRDGRLPLDIQTAAIGSFQTAPHQFHTPHLNMFLHVLVADKMNRIGNLLYIHWCS